MFSEAFKEGSIAVLIVLSVGFAGIVFAEAVANSLNHTYNPFNQAQEEKKNDN